MRVALAFVIGLAFLAARRPPVRPATVEPAPAPAPVQMTGGPPFKVVLAISADEYARLAALPASSFYVQPQRLQ